MGEEGIRVCSVCGRQVVNWVLRKGKYFHQDCYRRIRRCQE